MHTGNVFRCVEAGRVLWKLGDWGDVWALGGGVVAWLAWVVRRFGGGGIPAHWAPELGDSPPTAAADVHALAAGVLEIPGLFLLGWPRVAVGEAAARMQLGKPEDRPTLAELAQVVGS